MHSTSTHLPGAKDSEWNHPPFDQSQPWDCKPHCRAPTVVDVKSETLVGASEIFTVLS